MTVPTGWPRLDVVVVGAQKAGSTHLADLLGRHAGVRMCPDEVPIFEDPFYAKCEKALRADGILVAQTESVHFHPNTVRQCFDTLSARFPRTELLWGAMATYPGSFWTFAMATKGLDPTVARRQPVLDTQLYTPEAHNWFFIPPPVRAKILTPSALTRA